MRSDFPLGVFCFKINYKLAFITFIIYYQSLTFIQFTKTYINKQLTNQNFGLKQNIIKNQYILITNAAVFQTGSNWRKGSYEL